MKPSSLPSLGIWLPLTVFLAFAGLLGMQALPGNVPLWLGALAMATLLVLVLHLTVARPASHLRLAASVFESQESIVIADPRGQFLRVNHAFSKLTGYSVEDVMVRNVRWFLLRRPDSASYRQIIPALWQQGHWEGEIRIRHRHCSNCPVWLSISAVHDESGNLTHYVGTLLDLRKTDNERTTTQRATAEEHAIGELLRLALQPLDSTLFLQRSLELLLTSLPWLSLLPKGVIFVNETDGAEESLRMAASHNLEPALLSRCARLPMGCCICGKVAQTRSILHATDGDVRHEIRFEGMQTHAHYSLPIMAGQQLLGVLTLYLPARHRQSPQEEAFLVRVTDVLSIGLSMRQAQADVVYHAQHDPLTGLPNRHLLLERLQQDIAMARRRKAFGAVLFIDLDHFKTFNDALGHTNGDALLGQIAERISQRVRTGDTVVRHGGDEFLVVLPDLGNDAKMASYEVRRVADKLRESIAEPIYLGGQQLHVTPSVGINLFPCNGDEPESILQHAEVAMYRAKQAGRDTIRFYVPEMQAAAEARLQLQNDLRHALDAGELMLHYQPQIDAHGRMLGVEALLRWRHAKRGMVSPAEFIPIAEETGLILAIGRWVLQQACEQIVAWQRGGHNLGSVAVNVSARQFHQADFVASVERILDKTGADPHRLELEMTESLLIDSLSEAVDKMQVLRRHGVRFSIDDFGTGYSSLAYLKRLPLDRLKIDQSFVQELTLDSKDAAIIQAILSIADHLGFEVIAEGVETESQRLALLEMGCTLFQGYHLGRPMAASELPLHLTP